MIRPVLSLLSLVLMFPDPESSAQEWTRFRGPNGSGISTATGIPTTWTEDDYWWQIDLPVKGNSSPVLWGKQLFLTGDDAENGRRSLLCIDAESGRLQWRRDYSFDAHYLHRDIDFASATPCVDEHGVIIVLSTPAQVLMITLSLEGEEQWRRDLGPYRGLHGAGGSPIIADGLVVLANDQMRPGRFGSYLSDETDMNPGKSFLIALNRATGETRWKIDRTSELAGYMLRPAFAASAIDPKPSSPARCTASLRSIWKPARSVGRSISSGMTAPSALRRAGVRELRSRLVRATFCRGSPRRSRP